MEQRNLYKHHSTIDHQVRTQASTAKHEIFLTMCRSQLQTIGYIIACNTKALSGKDSRDLSTSCAGCLPHHIGALHKGLRLHMWGTDTKVPLSHMKSLYSCTTPTWLLCRRWTTSNKQIRKHVLNDHGNHSGKIRLRWLLG